MEDSELTDLEIESIYAEFATGSFETTLLTQVEIVVQIYISPSIVLCSIGATLVTILSFAFLTREAFAFNVFCLIASVAELIAFAFQPNASYWISSQLGREYPEVLKVASDAACVCFSFLGDFLRQLPRYMIICLVLERFVVRFSFRHVQLGYDGDHKSTITLKKQIDRYARDVILLCVTFLLISNIHYFWTHGLKRFEGQQFQGMNAQCKLITEGPKTDEFFWYGYLLNVYKWLLEDLLPVFVIVICFLIDYGKRRCSCSSSRQLCHPNSSGCCVIRSTGNAEQQVMNNAKLNLDTGSKTASIQSILLYDRSAAAENNDLNYSQNNSKTNFKLAHVHQNSKELLICTVPHLATAYLACHVPLLAMVFVKKVLIIYDDDAFGDASHLIMFCCNILECSYAFISLLIYFWKYESFRKKFHQFLLKQFKKITSTLKRMM